MGIIGEASVFPGIRAYEKIVRICGKAGRKNSVNFVENIDG